ncbi:hypothetical protein C8R43DRAFT_967802 [Mycena crocata]|nr:hypothetical protein C8R43DRAFT_967802 [Mycena crocata]
MNVESSYSALSSLGAPVTAEEFTRLCNGPLADALQFLSEHIVGRQNAATARQTLFLWHEERAKSHLKQPHTTRSGVEKAVARLSSAKKSSALHSTQLVDLQAKAHTAQAQKDDLQKQLNEKRRLLLLLQVLQAKQTLRTKRIEQMTKEIAALKQVALDSTQSCQHISFQTPPEMPPMPKARVSNIKDCMAELHSYNIRLSQLIATPTPKDAFLRLQRVVGSLGGESQELNRCISVARARANHKLQLKLGNRSATIRELDTKQHSNRKKELALQQLADLSAALRLLCEHHVQSIMDFTQTIAYTLRRSLREESRLSKGHVDILRSSLVSDRLVEPPGESESFLSLIARVIRVHGNTSVHADLVEVERVIRQSHRRHGLVQAGRLPQRVRVDTAPIDKYRSSTQAAHDRATKLLTRKAEKAVMGRSLASDVEVLLRESRLAIGLPLKD